MKKAVVVAMAALFVVACDEHKHYYPTAPSPTAPTVNTEVHVHFPGCGHVCNTCPPEGPETPPEPRPPAPVPPAPPAPPPPPEPPVEPPVAPPVPPGPPAPPAPPPAPPEEEALCHIRAGRNGRNEVTLYLPPSAVRAHLRQHEHDYIGECEGHSPTDR